MKVFKLLNHKDFEHNMKTIDDDFRAGRITREQAATSKRKITDAFKSGENNRMVAKAFEASKINGKVLQ